VSQRPNRRHHLGGRLRLRIVPDAVEFDDHCLRLPDPGDVADVCTGHRVSQSPDKLQWPVVLRQGRLPSPVMFCAFGVVPDVTAREALSPCESLQGAGVGHSETFAQRRRSEHHGRIVRENLSSPFIALEHRPQHC
jgi:hypothetical protein